MENKVIIKANKVKKVVCVVQYVFKANFNDTYYLEEIVMDLESIKEDGELFYFDPFMGRSKINDTMVAISYVDDEKFTLVTKKNNEITYESKDSYLDFILTEPYDDSMFLSASISLKTK